nr:PREDICTED: protein NLRC5-like [Latimeria chalumnae]|eukprot:XP_014344563.1 PREDICTED: protein NLRC5-like [Latimeria chalumnae]
MTTNSNIREIQVCGGEFTVVFSDGAETPSGVLSFSKDESETAPKAGNRKLGLRQRSLGLKHVEKLAMVLEGCPGLSEVDLSGNCFGDKGCRRLMTLLPKFHISKLLNLSKNGISAEGVWHLSNSLNVSPKAVEVDVR